MRIVPLMRLCYCRRCKTKVFILRNPQWWPYFVYTYYRRRSDTQAWAETRPMPSRRRGPTRTRVPAG